ncbi:unnamed protein product [Ilex paraguariensis]|uniref:Uncharacterized protein n=1 Tax=Ilex paraguariensis TaxID=185542 RepID=A0ABC8ULR5_9AQUA
MEKLFSPHFRDTPMDYDDNDCQGQNLHLAGEGSSKFSPVLRPYSLPKFDFDDSLQGHLRFDSLVENEVFLGIPGQEDNQWIEDFSRGSSGIEFGSSAAESCSISRRKNVWSEATSLESVEMLLKSVGQEEVAPGETAIEESDAGDKLGSVTKQMEPNLKLDDEMEDVTDPHPAVPPDEFVENFSGVNESAGYKGPVVKCTSQTQEAELSAYGISSDLDPNTVREKGGLFVTHENLGIDRNCDDAMQNKIDTITQEDSGMQTTNGDSSSENVVAITVKLSNQEIPHQVSDSILVNTIDFSKETDEGVEEDCVPSKAVNMDDQILGGPAVGSCPDNLNGPTCVALKVLSVEEHAVETSITNLDEPSMVREWRDDIKTAEDCNEAVFSKGSVEGSRHEIFFLSDGKESSRQFKSNVHGESSVVSPRRWVDDGFGCGHNAWTQQAI